MRAKLFLVFAAVLVCVFSTAAQNVIESESSVVINDRTADVTLTVVSPTTKESSVHLALLDNADSTRAVIDQSTKLVSGKRKYKFTLQIGDLMKTASDEIAWYRLSYRIGTLSGVASLSQLMRDDFDLRASAFERVIPGQAMRIRVRSLNPFTEEAVKGVQIKVELNIDLDTEADDDTVKLNGTARTGANGFAYVDLKIPENIKLDGSPDITIVGQKNGVVRKIEEDLNDDQEEGSVLLMTDKPLYQPGQTFSIRALYLDPNNTVVPDSELQFTFEDENEAVVYRQTVKTSAFGIASVSWPIPENARLGSYNVVVHADEDLREDRLYFKVTRYDLPNFSVTAKPDKTYYLPSDAEAHIAVNADYLFGKPVTQGKVRVVQESDRHWNYSAQEYESTEGEAVDGQADASGKFVAKFDLRKHFLDLQGREWERYRDVSFSAYYTDLTTNRTEQRRFDIRLTKEPIHVYLMRYDHQHPDLPLTAYVSTFYADGTPAICDVEIRDRKETVNRFQSNSLGAGKFEFRIPKDSIKGDKYDINVTARDKKGRVGTMEESFYMDSDDIIQVRTDQTIYKPDDTVEVDILSTQDTGYIYVDVIKDWSAVDSALVMLHNGKAHLSIPYKPAFKGDLMIAAYSDKEEGRCCDMRAVRGIIFPEQQNLILNAKFSKDEFRPAEDATVRFSVMDGSHHPIESAIGLGIFDKAIEERARTETEFGEYFSRFYRYLGYDRSFGNITLKDLNDLDMTRPVSPEMQLAAEIMLSGGWYFPTILHSGNLDSEAKTLYHDAVEKQLKPVSDALNAQYKKDFDHPTDAASLDRILRANGIDLVNTRDPWGDAYTPNSSVNRTEDVMELKSAGPDKTPGTPDDFVAFSAGFNYFRKIGEAVDRAVLLYKSPAGKYIRDLETLVNETRKQGVDIADLKDRWGRDYRFYFEVAGRNYTIRVLSVGPNGVEEPNKWQSDDFDVWTSDIDYFGESEAAVNRVLDQEVNFKKKPFPRDEKSFIEMLRANGLDIASIKDGYGRPAYVVGHLESQYVDKTKMENGKTSITPVTQEMMMFKLRSMGKDGAISGDDADLATFSGAVTEAYKGTNFAKADVRTVVFSGAKGAISGVVTDPNGAVIPGASVTAIDKSDETKIYTTASDDEGKFLIGNLPSGLYRVRVDAQGFKSVVSDNVEVRSQTLVEVNARLEAGAVSEVVTVTAESREMNQTSSMSATEVKTSTKTGMRISFPYKDQSSTPRLREYFPETLVWQPELITDKKGKAELNFKMADNITTWKMFAIASTKKGKMGVVEKEVTAFQSFFVDLDPPKFLTEGDEIYLPTQVRNYTDKAQKVDVTMDKADWFAFLGGAKQQVSVPTGGSENAVFGFRAAMPVTAGKQRVTAIGQTDSDAIERPVTVRPNGEEIVRTDSRYFTGSAKLDVDFPANALPGTQKTELKIYPNLFSQVTDSVEGLLERPYGCGEQTISSTYPDLMILKFVKTETPLRQKAARYLQRGYERLLGYQVADGGFSYWGGKDAPDMALTAYALRFLNDAKGFIAVDDEVIKKAHDWLINQQRTDGSWSKKYSWETTEDVNRTKMLTTYIVRTLAMLKAQSVNGSASANTASTAVPADPLTKGLAYLKTRNAEIDEPYALALFGLASLDAGDAETAKQIAARLEKMAIAEGSAAYWKLETNTPFYGWGTAGRVETTALVLQLLTRVAKVESKPAPDVASKGLLFLLKNKDRYGVWYSTQTTINVLDAFLAILALDGPPQPQTLLITINGAAQPDVAVAADRIEPLVVDLSAKLSATSNSIEVRGAANAPLMAQTVATHYIDWRDSKSTNTDIGPSRALKLDYKCDKTNPAVMEEVTCSVDAERIGFRGYGMLLAEIGTPPGADVSRESLEAALQNDWSLSRYDILPDRIVLYMWSKAGGTKFNFKFRPRYRINAQTPGSIVYDYYNPEAQATVAPLRFATR